MRLSIAIVSYNTAPLLARCLDSIARCAADLEPEIIVVDNGSADDSVALVQMRYPAVRLILPGRNTFYSAGNNLAIRAAQGDAILVLNPDTELHPGALQALAAHLEADPACGLVTAHQIWTDGRTTLPICSRFNTYTDLWLGATFAGALLPAWREARRARMWYADWDRLSDREVDVAPGSCMLLRRAALETVGLFDEAMPMYFSDDDLCWRLKVAGYTVQYLAGAIITHAERATTRHISRRARQMYYADLGVYARKHFGRLRAAPLIAAAQLTRRLLDRREAQPGLRAR